MYLNVHRNRKAYWGPGGGGGRGADTEIGAEGNYTDTYRYTVITRMTSVLSGQDESHFNVS